MLHHVFEHMDNPLAVLKRLRELLKPSGTLLIRIPVSDSYAWRKYGVNWFQLDAPRHFYLHTTRSIAYLAKQSGWALQAIIYDSMACQFYSSEGYRCDVPFLQQNNPIFRKIKWAIFKQWFNAIHDGDQACFVLKKVNNEKSFNID
jgi:predicted SAM-dependent methyltransferase